MRHMITHALAPLASIAYQRRYIIHGDIKGYIIPWELLEDAINALNITLSDKKYQQRYSSEELSCLASMLATIKNCPYTQDVPLEELVERHKGWAAVRSQAQECLQIMNFDLVAWEKENIDFPDN
ncbi:MAG: hypothetical protein JWM56_157 [Candidatus Peribacteria bacterium]|nr:hypothetical protein [Candidatus Peribacteria bacterium]